MFVRIVSIDVLSSLIENEHLRKTTTAAANATTDINKTIEYVHQNHKTYATKHGYSISEIKENKSNLQTKVEYVIEWLKNDKYRIESWMIMLNNNFVFGDVTLSMFGFFEGNYKQHILLIPDLYDKAKMSTDVFFVHRDPFSLLFFQKLLAVLNSSHTQNNIDDLFLNYPDDITTLQTRYFNSGFGINTLFRWPLGMENNQTIEAYSMQPGDYLTQSPLIGDDQQPNSNILKDIRELCSIASVINSHQSAWILLVNKPNSNWEELKSRKIAFVVDLLKKDDDMRKFWKDMSLNYVLPGIIAVSGMTMFFVLQKLHVSDAVGRVWRWIRLRRDAVINSPLIFKKMRTIERGLINGNSSAQSKFIQITKKPKSTRKGNAVVKFTKRREGK